MMELKNIDIGSPLMRRQNSNDNPDRSAFGSMRGQPSIRVRDKSSIKLPNNQSQRMTFRSENRSKANDFVSAMLEIPKETDHCILFPWDDELKEFVIEDETKVNAVENLTREDLYKVFEELKKSEFYDLYGNMHMKLMTPFAVLLFGIIVFILFFRDKVHSSNNNNVVVVVFFCLFGVIFLLIIIISIFWARYLKKRLNQRETDFNRILNDLNSEYFCDKDVFWKCGKLGTYIQLDLNYKFNGIGEDNNKSRGKTSNVSMRNKISISLNLDQTNTLAKILDDTRKSILKK